MITSLLIDDLTVHSTATTAIRKVTGLGAPPPRQHATPRSSNHGSLDLTRWYDGRTIDLEGQVTGPTIWQDFDTIKSRLALGSPHILTFTRLGRDDAEQVLVRVASPVDNSVDVITSVLTWTVSLLAADPRLYGASLKSGTYDPTAALAGGGMAVPMVFPLVFTSSTASELYLTNTGSFSTPPVLTIHGPVSYPIVDNDTTGESVAVNYVLGSSDLVVIDVANRSITLNGASRIDLFVPSGSSWWEMRPGENRIRLRGGSLASGVSALTVSYRDANI